MACAQVQAWHLLALLARFAARPQTPALKKLTSMDGASLPTSRRRDTSPFSHSWLDSGAADSTARPLSVSDDPG